MGGHGSGRKPDPMKQFFPKRKGLPTGQSFEPKSPIMDGMYLANRGGIKPEAYQGAKFNLNDLSDVNTSGVATNDVIKFDGVNWLDGRVAGSELSDDIFVKIAGDTMTGNLVADGGVHLNDDDKIGFGNTVGSPDFSIKFDSAANRLEFAGGAVGVSPDFIFGDDFFDQNFQIDLKNQKFTFNFISNTSSIAADDINFVCDDVIDFTIGGIKMMEMKEAVSDTLKLAASATTAFQITKPTVGVESVTINPTGANMDFFVESDNLTAAIKVDASTDTISLALGLSVGPTLIQFNGGQDANMDLQMGDDTSSSAAFKLDAGAQTVKIYGATFDLAGQDMRLAGTNKAVIFGATDPGNCSIYFDGTDMILNPALAGGGNTVKIGTAANMRLSTGGFTASIVSKTSAYTATATDHTILCGAGNQSFTVTLPDVSSAVGTIYCIKNIGTGTITINPAASDLIDGAGSHAIAVQYGTVIIQTDGTDWFKLSIT